MGFAVYYSSLVLGYLLLSAWTSKGYVGRNCMYVSMSAVYRGLHRPCTGQGTF